MTKICYRFALFFTLLLIFSCNQKEIKIPEGIIQKDTMVKLMADIQMVEAVIQLRNLNTSDSTKELGYGYYKFVFAKHKVSYDSFFTSYEFYANHPELMDEMYKNMITDISAKQANFHPTDTIFTTPPPEPVLQKEDSSAIKKIREKQFRRKMK